MGEEEGRAAKKIVCGVYVISTCSGERVNAMTAAWVMRASFSPPLVTVAVGRERFTHAMIIDSGVFAVNVLGPGGEETGRHFGLRSGRDLDKFKGVDYETRVTGSPILKDAVAWLDCTLHSHHEAGDHTIMVGEVVGAGVRGDDTPPLVYDRAAFFG